jgi:hypothetical protein
LSGNPKDQGDKLYGIDTIKTLSVGTGNPKDQGDKLYGIDTIKTLSVGTEVKLLRVNDLPISI